MTIRKSLHNTPGRPIAAIVGLDPAYSGQAGLSVLVRRPLLDSGRDAGPTSHTTELHSWQSCGLREVVTQRWLGDVVAQVCRPGERVLLVSESDVFGSHSVARKLGIGVGIVEGLLLDLNATDPDSRLDVTTTQWRRVIQLKRGTKLPKAKNGDPLTGRDLHKARAVAYVKQRFGITLPVDAAEATCVACWYADGDLTWGTHERPIPHTPTGMKKRT